jgi:hypothetical protein
MVDDMTTETFRFLGHTIRVRSNSHEVLRHLKSVYNRFHVESEKATDNIRDAKSGEDHLITIVDRIKDSREIVISDKLQTIRLKCRNFEQFDPDYYQLPLTVPDPLAFIQWSVLEAVLHLANDFFLFHACAVSWNGHGIICPGVSGMGKTTLTLQLVKHGFKFLSDEIACLQPDVKTIEPFYRTLNLTDESRKLLNLGNLSQQQRRRTDNQEIEWTMDIEDLYADSLSGPCDLSHILFLRGFAERPQLEYINPTNALFRIFRCLLSPVEEPAAAMFRFAPLLNETNCFDLVVGDLEETVTTILDLIGHQDAIK